MADVCTLATDNDGGKIYKCNQCERSFKTRGCFTQHHKHVHLKMRPKLRSCHLCDVKVPGYMRAFHMEEAHGLPAPACGACGKKFAYPFQVLQHQKIYHMGEKSFTCKTCDMKFPKHHKLLYHERKHSSLRSYKCEFCEKSFRWQNNLKIHLRMHLDDRRHVCAVCSEAFVQRTSLKYHISKKHPDMV